MQQILTLAITAAPLQQLFKYYQIIYQAANKMPSGSVTNQAPPSNLFDFLNTFQSITYWNPTPGEDFLILRF